METWLYYCSVVILGVLYGGGDVGGERFLIMSEVRQAAVFRMELNGSEHTRYPIASLSNPIAVAFEPFGNSIFVTERGSASAASPKTITKYGINANSVKRSLPRIAAPDGIAVDPVSQLVYYSDAGENFIAALDTNLLWHTAVLTQGLDNPRGIALDPVRGTMYWTDWGAAMPHIGKAYMDGTDPTIIVTNQLRWPNGLALDTMNNELFWCDAGLFRIERVTTDGSNRRVILMRPQEHFFGLALDEKYLYWTAWNRPAIQRALRSGFGDAEHLGKVYPLNTTRLSGLVLVNPSEEVTGSNACSGDDRGGCQQLCLPRKASLRTCACNDGFSLNSDGTSCALLRFRRGLILTDQERNGVFAMDLDTKVDFRIRIWGHKDPKGVTYDAANKTIFWTDSTHKFVARGTLSGKDVAVIKHFGSTAAPEGIALDASARMLYIVDSGRDIIFRVPTRPRLTQDEDVLIDTGLEQPRAIVLDLSRRMMYWTDWGTNMKIERATMEGEGRQTIIGSNLGWPNGIAINMKAGKLFWTDGRRNTIESANTDGTDRTVLLSDPNTFFLGLTMSGNYLYFSGLSNRSIFKMDIASKKVVSVGKGNFRTVFDLHYFPEETVDPNVKIPDSGTTENPDGGAPIENPDGDPPTENPDGDPPTGPPSRDNTAVIAAAVTVTGVILITIIIVAGVVCYRYVSAKHLRRPVTEDNLGFTVVTANVAAAAPAPSKGMLAGRPLPAPPENPQPPSYAELPDRWPNVGAQHPILSIIGGQDLSKIPTAPPLTHSLPTTHESPHNPIQQKQRKQKQHRQPPIALVEASSSTEVHHRPPAALPADVYQNQGVVEPPAYSPQPQSPRVRPTIPPALPKMPNTPDDPEASTDSEAEDYMKLVPNDSDTVGYTAIAPDPERLAKLARRSQDWSD